MKYYKKIFIIVICVFSIFTIYKIVKTYSLFESEIGTTNNIDVGSWNIKVNNQDVVSGTSHDFIITNDNIAIPRNVNVQSGKIAPGSRGTFEINIEPEDTQVSIRYDIELNENLISNTSFKITDISSRNVNIVRTDENTYTGVILLSDIVDGYFQSVDISFRWENDENNNENDTAIGQIYNNSINIPIKITFTQYLGETITPYDPGEEK